jgi:hypothetical protein
MLVVVIVDLLNGYGTIGSHASNEARYITGGAVPYILIRIDPQVTWVGDPTRAIVINHNLDIFDLVGDRLRQDLSDFVRSQPRGSLRSEVKTDGVTVLMVSDEAKMEAIATQVAEIVVGLMATR